MKRWLPTISLGLLATIITLAVQLNPLYRTGTFNSTISCVTSSTTAHTCTFSAAVSAGDLLVVCAMTTSANTTAISDSVNGSYTLDTSIQNINGVGARRLTCGYLANSASGTPTVTVTSASSTTAFVMVAAFSGVKTTSPRITSNLSANLSSSTTPQCATVTPTATNQLIVGAIFTDNANPNTIDPNNGESEIGQSDDPGTTAQMEWKLSTGTTAFAMKWLYDVADTGGCGVMIFDLQAAAAPTYTTSPTISARTTNSVSIDQKSACSDCTAYFVAETDGLGAPTCTQIKAGQGADGNAAYKSANGAMTANTTKTLTLSSWTDGNKKDGYGCMHSTAGGDSTVASIADIDKIPVSSCSFASEVNGSISYSCTLDGPGTIYIVACLYNSTHATVTQVETAKCTGGVAAEAAANRSGTGSLTVGSTLPFPIYDVSYVGIYNFGSQHEAATHTDLGRYQAPPTGFQYITLASVTTVGSVPKAYNDAAYVTIPYDTQTGNFHVGDIVVDTTSGAWGIILVDGDAGTTGTLTIYKKSGTFANNDALRDSQGGAALVNGSEGAVVKIAVGDILQLPNHVSPAGDTATCPGDPACLTVDTNGQYSYTAGGRQTVLNGLIYDVSASGFTALDLDVYFNNTAPGCGSPQTIVVKTGVAMTTLQLSLFCSDDDNEAVHYAIVAGTNPAGLALNWTTGDEAGTPTVENEAGVTLTVIVYDSAGDSTTQLVTVYPITSWTVPDVSTETSSVAQSTIDALTHRSVAVESTYLTCTPGSTTNIVDSTNPAAGQEVVPFTSLILNLERQCASGGSGGRTIGIRIGVGL